MRSFVVAILLTVGLSGCFAATDGPAPETAPTADLSAVVMDGAETLAANATSATFRWTDSVGPGVKATVNSARNQGVWERASAPFDLPTGWVVHATATLTWDADDVDLGLFVRDGLTERRCGDMTGGGAAGKRSCEAVLWSPDGLRGSLDVEVNANPRVDVPFVAELKLDLLRPTTQLASVVAPRPCEHPWPCADGSEWPLDLEGPFDLLEYAEVRIPSHDGVLLHGWSWRPALPEGVGAPTVLIMSPYLGNEGGEGMLNNLYGRQALTQFVPRGFAVFLMEVRGTGGSGGCFGHHDMPAQLDPAALIDWIADQPWSNGRVGMTGLSYMGVASMHGAIHASEALKAVVPSGVPHAYLYHFTPQGAYSTSAGGYEATQHTIGTPPVATTTGPEATVTSLTVAPERQCDEFRRNLVVEAIGQAHDDRDPAFWELRNMYAGYPDITAAVFITEGFNDPYIRWGQEVAWELIDAPKRILFGQWPHIDGGTPSWYHDRLLWFDYWLKGVGVPPGVGVVQFQDDARKWHATTAWPSAEANEEILHLTPKGMTPGRSEGSVSYRSTPLAPGASALESACGAGGPAAEAVAFRSDPLDMPAVVAGNPFAYVTLTSDQPGGLVGLRLYRIPADAPCIDAELLTWGAADLRFHAGNLIGTDFPVGTPTPVRFDLEPIASALEAGDRLLVVLAHPGPYEQADLADGARVLPDGPSTDGRIGQPYLPVITVHAGAEPTASHIVLPLVQGSTNGPAPTLAYPPRPFLTQ